LSETLNLTVETTAMAPLPMQMWEWCVSDTDSLALTLSRRLLWMPELSLSDDGQPLVESLPTIARVLSTACVEGRSVQTAFERWLHKQDYRFIERLLGAMRNETDAANTSRQYQEALDGSREALQARLADTNAAIEQAVVDGIIDEAMHSAYSARVVAMQPEDILHFAPRYAELDQVRHDLVVAHKNRLAALHEEWRELETRLTGSHIEPASSLSERTL
jgi:hypothetical protein